MVYSLIKTEQSISISILLILHTTINYSFINNSSIDGFYLIGFSYSILLPCINMFCHYQTACTHLSIYMLLLLSNHHHIILKSINLSILNISKNCKNWIRLCKIHIIAFCFMLMVGYQSHEAFFWTSF